MMFDHMFDHGVDPYWTVPDLLTSIECQSMIDLAERVGFEQAAINHPSGAVLDLDTRNNERVIMDNPALAGMLFDKLQGHLPNEMFGMELAGMNERIRFYRYRPGHYFKRHRDGVVKLNDGRISCLSVLVYLNRPGSGGETLIEGLAASDEKDVIIPEVGMCFLMQHRLIHEGAELKDGVKYVLRSDVMYRMGGA